MQVLKFSTSHCGQCMLVTERMRNARVKFTEVDCEQQPELAEKYGIRNVPVVIVLNDDGTERNRYANVPAIMKAVSIGALKDKL